MNRTIKVRLSILLAGFGLVFAVGCTPLPTTSSPSPALSESGGMPAKNWNDKAASKMPIPEPTKSQARGSSEDVETVRPVAPDVHSIYEHFLTNRGLSMTPAKPTELARVTAAWNNKIIFAPDPTHGGELMPGIMGRLYLFGPDEAVPLATEGELVVGVWDNSPKTTGGQPKLLELWYIDRDTMKKLMKKDFMGNGYTVFLPFSKYHVDLKQINVLARFNSVDGRSMMASPEILTLDHSAALQRAADKLGVRPEKDLFLDKPEAKTK